MTDIQAHPIPCGSCWNDSGWEADPESPGKNRPIEGGCPECGTGCDDAEYDRPLRRTFGFSEPVPEIDDKIIVQPSWVPPGRVAVLCPVYAQYGALGHDLPCPHHENDGMYLTVTLTDAEAREWGASALTDHASTRRRWTRFTPHEALAAAEMLKHG